MRGFKNTFYVLFLFLITAGCGNEQEFYIAPAAESFSGGATYNSKVDLLWVVDNSRSMTQHQQNISNQFAAFIDVLDAKRIDYNIAITTMDMSASGEKGRFIGVPKVITSHTPNARNLFRSNILIGEQGSDVERGLEAMVRALAPDRLGNENAGFYRPDAFLAVIFVTNEDDFSSGSPSSYAHDLDELKGFTSEGQRLWMANFIGITEPNGECFTRGEIADPGDRYMDLTQQSNGQISEICSDDLTQALANVRVRIVERLTEFRLNREPDIGSIRVYVNGNLVPQDAVDGWTYHPAGYVIKFHGNAVPDAEARVHIDYQPLRPI